MSRLIVMNKHQEELDKPAPDEQELYIRLKGKATWDVLVLCGDSAVMELGYNEDAEIGLNALEQEVEGNRAILILDTPAMNQQVALAAAIKALSEAGLIPSGADIHTGTWEDFSDHPDAQMYLRLKDLLGAGDEVNIQEDDLIPLDLEALSAQLGYTPESLEKARLESERDDQAAYERGRLRFQQAKESV